MAASTYLLKVVKFKPKSGVEVTFTGVTDMGSTESGSVVDLQTDAQSHNSSCFMDQIKATATFSTTDLSLVDELRVGDRGKLTLIYQKRIRGRGADAGNDIKYETVDNNDTDSTAVISDIQRPGPSTGFGVAVITFSISDGDNALDPELYSGYTSFWKVSVGTFT
jgi:hypothetical protein